MAAAVGVRFLDKRSRAFIPNGQTLADIAHIDLSGLDARISASRLQALVDVQNPLFGMNGAAFVYGPQKGASPQQVLALDSGLRHINAICLEKFGVNYAAVPGAGAAGGLGFGCLAMLGASLTSGIETILAVCGFRDEVADADLVITGEGRLDAQSFSGKVLSGILRQAAAVPVLAICGVLDCEESLLREHGLTVFAIGDEVAVEVSLDDPERYLRATVAKALDVLFDTSRGMR